MYTKDLSELIYYSQIQEEFIFKFGIHHSIFSKSIKTGAIYLDKYVFTNQPIERAKLCLMSDEDLKAMLEKDRLEIKQKEKASRKVILIAESDKDDIKSFDSIKDCIAFLNTIAPSNKTTLYSYVEKCKNDGDHFYWHIFEKWWWHFQNLKICINNKKTHFLGLFSFLF